MRFDEIDFEDEVLDGLYDMNFEEMTPVQEATIPVILEGSDLIACAQTGTGKTAAYTLPLLNKLLVEGNEDNVVKTLDGGSHARAGHADRHPVAGILLLHARLDDGGLRRRRRPRLEQQKQGMLTRRRRA